MRDGESVVCKQDNTVYMPYWYWLNIEYYIISTETNKDILRLYAESTAKEK